MTGLREAAQQALETLEDAQRHHYALRHAETDTLIAALRAALAEPTWCEAHQHYKWCEHNGGKLGPAGWEAP